MRVISRLRGSIGEGRRWLGAAQSWHWFRAGYMAAIRDIERNGMPLSSEQAHQDVDHALEHWISTGRLP